jgi:hypothetical protein
MFLSVPAIWTRDNTGREDLNISPYLTWFYRKISLAAEYNYHQVKQDSNERTDQRIYIRLTRYFNGYLF